ncbi:MAG: peptidase M50 [Brevundimonas sp.]|nr:peptidase M50 [Brevundimonas sp.]
MSDANTPRRPGPWDPKPEDNIPAPKAVEARPSARADTPANGPASGPANGPLASTSAHPVVQGQSPAWAIISTLLLGGLIYLWTGRLEIVAAVLFGVLVHEVGHMLAMNRLGMGPARIFIVPFFGGAAVGQRPAASEWHGVLVALAGPAFGLLAAAPFMALFAVTDQPIWLSCVFAIAFINLLNLLPAPMLDGSRAIGPVLARIHPLVEKAVLLVIGGLAIVWGVSNGSWLFALFLAIAVFSYLKRDGWRPEGRRLSWGEAAKSTGLFLLTIIACLGVGLVALLPGVETLAAAAGQVYGLFEFGR